MSDISDQLQNVWAAIAHSAGGTGANIMFVSTGFNDDGHEIAREFAKLSAARASKAVLLMDLDFAGNGQYLALGGNEFKWQGPFDLSLTVKPFWRVNPRNRELPDIERKLVVGYRVGNSKLFVSKCRLDKIGESQAMQIGSNASYWKNVKNNFEICIVDAPPFDRSKAGLAVVPDMDGIIMVVDNDGDPRDAISLRDELQARGGNILGVVVIQRKQDKKRVRKVA